MSLMQLAEFAAENGHADAQVIIGGDFNSLWRKYASDQFDQVRHLALPFSSPSIWKLGLVWTGPVGLGAGH